MSRARILVCAAACHPDYGSEEGVGWTWVSELSSHCDLEVIAGDNLGAAAAIGARLRDDPELRERVRFHFLPWFAPLPTRFQRFAVRYYQPLYYVHYRRWMRRAGDLAARLCAEQRFDLAHQLTMIGYREPGFLWELPLPFVWGPVGGTQNVPWRFLPSLGPLEGARHAARNTVNWFHLRGHRRFKTALHRAAAVLAVAPDTQRLLCEVHGVESTIIHEVFTNPAHPLARERVAVAGRGLRLVFSGMHLSRKGLPYVLRALQQAGGDHRLDVLGTGPMTEAWQREAATCGVAARVTWHGQLPRARALAIMSQADAMVFPSLLEATSTVVAEALSLGLPVLTLNHHGMADMVDDTCGVRLPVLGPRRLVRDLAAALERLVAPGEALVRLSRGALARAHEYSAEKQIPKVCDLYEQAIARGRIGGGGLDT